MSDFSQEQPERLSPQQAADRLIDIAYSLVVGGPLELSMANRSFRVPVANELHRDCVPTPNRDRVELEVELRWCAPTGASSGRHPTSD
jgi:hypothetical protein